MKSFCIFVVLISLVFVSVDAFAEEEWYPMCSVKYKVRIRNGNWDINYAPAQVESMEECRNKAKEIAFRDAHRGLLDPNTVQVISVSQSGRWHY